MTPLLPAQTLRALERLKRAFAPEKIILFGSYAKGTHRSGSDIDLLLIADLQGDPAAHQRRARQLTSDCFPPIDVVFQSREDLAEAHVANSPFLMSILESGVTLFSRPGSPSTIRATLPGDGALHDQHSR